MWGDEIDNNIERSKYHINLYLHSYCCGSDKGFHRNQEGIYEAVE